MSTTTDRLTPTQDLILELLAARYRLGHHGWTLTASPAVHRALDELARQGLVIWKYGVKEGTYLAWMTEDAKAVYLSATYVPPILGGEP